MISKTVCQQITITLSVNLTCSYWLRTAGNSDKSAESHAYWGEDIKLQSSSWDSWAALMLLLPLSCGAPSSRTTAKTTRFGPSTPPDTFSQQKGQMSKVVIYLFHPRIFTLSSAYHQPWQPTHDGIVLSLTLYTSTNLSEPKHRGGIHPINQSLNMLYCTFGLLLRTQ